MKVVSAREAVDIIQDGWCIVPGGFGSCGHPDALTRALRSRFLETGQPRALRLLFGAGPGDRRGNGADALALDNLVAAVIGGFWGLCPKLGEMARAGRIEAHNWPQGIISKLFSEIAAGAPGIVSPVGLGTFVDPIVDGGVVDTAGSRPLVERIELRGNVYLFYPSQRVDCALLRGTAADEHGNISFSEETSSMDALAQAQAARNSGGKVIVQVKRLVGARSARVSDVRIPGFLVDYVVVAGNGDHPQTYGKSFDASYTSRTARPAAQTRVAQSTSLAKQIVTGRAAMELIKHSGKHINLGIGVPARIGSEAKRMAAVDYTLTVESGVIGGIPDDGLSFGASMNPDAVIEQSSLFDFYDGGGIDIAFLGFGEVDAQGNVNVSRFDGRMPGSGGFINISQAARKLVFCGTLTTRGLETEIRDGRLVIVKEGTIRKFTQRVSHLTFNGARSRDAGQEVMFVTERAVFRLGERGLTLVEIAPGLTADQLREAMDCDFKVPGNLTTMPVNAS
ncbi:acyl CoA:acetate/3-ketoacid CoA transferase [Paraburkholderia humisilvae]|uniref:Acetate CoA-transferase YdiF n=1 Tax=Paraburkholderia humisilvae TaxID=627669 RepID=A0A6J5F585_9BURK|nr:CoA-transferase [Paraburkholderia humisilvae]CAB3772485.1 Caffeate CoA-transferase [Paraburkholderia humisilvae]